MDVGAIEEKMMNESLRCHGKSSAFIKDEANSKKYYWVPNGVYFFGNCSGIRLKINSPTSEILEKQTKKINFYG